MKVPIYFQTFSPRQETLVSIVFYNTNPNNCDRIEASKENRTERTVKGVWNENFRRLFCFGRKEGSIMDVRMQEHPILGAMGLSKKVKFQYNGTELEGYEGEPIAMALKAAGVMVHRYTQKEHQPRSIFCAIGRCTDCVMIVNGKPNVRTCVTPLEAGMQVQTQYGVSAEPFSKQP